MESSHGHDDAARLSAAIEQLVRWLRSAPVVEPLSPGAASLLSRLRSDGPRRIADLTRTENISQPAVTQLVRRLEGEGLVDRVPSDHDRRSVLVHLTDAGARALDERRARRVARLDEHLSTLDPEQRAAIVAALPALDALTAPSA